MQLAGTNAIHLHRDGVLHSFLPGDELPDWAVGRITNPYALGDQAEPDAEPDDDGDEDENEGGGMPPKSGPAASRQVWEDYAKSKDIEVDPDWKRDDIIAAVEAANAAAEAAS